MSLQARDSRQMKRAGRNMEATGANLLLAGGLIAAAGILLMLLFDADVPEGLGLGLAWLATPITVLGVALFVIARVGRRAANDEPFA